MGRTLLCILVAALFAVCVPAASAAGPATTKRALAAQMAGAGSGSGAYVVDLDSGATLYKKAASTSPIPAPVEKLFTSATALLRYGPDSVLNTPVLGDSAPDPTGVLNGNLYLRGGGDPTLDTAAIGQLANALVTSTNLTEVTG